ncbi:MAG TPA: PAS domain-containing sensor histidine kinase [Acidimicrobiales bacterium]|nr:PAS domain-containing sensor histidine kinase [Acidimicrobiales bacterium]
MRSDNRQGNWLTWAVGAEGDPPIFAPALYVGTLYISAALIACVLAALPDLQSSKRVTILASGIVAVCLGVVLIRGRPMLNDIALVCFFALGTSWMGAEVYLLGAGNVLALLFWFAPTSFVLLPGRAALGESGYAAIVPGVIYGATGQFGQDNAAGAARQWILTAAAIALLSAVFWVLRTRLRDRNGVLGKLANELSIGIEVVGPDGRYRAVNSALSIMLGRSRTEIVGRHIDDFVFPDDAEMTGTALSGLLSGTATSTVFEGRFRRSDGEAVHAIVTAASVVPEPNGPHFVLGLAQDVSEQRRLDAQRAELAQLLLRAQENERRRIADEVHDDPLQTLIALSIQLQILEGRLKDKSALGVVDDLKRAVALSIEQMRSLLFELHPPALHLGGLTESLTEFIRRYESAGGPKVRFESSLATEPTADEAITLFRITAEALTNSRKHADAHNVTVSVLDSQGGIALTVADDGIGMDNATQIVPGHLGVASMRERAERAGGSFEISSTPGAGTTVRAWIPRGDS